MDDQTVDEGPFSILVDKTRHCHPVAPRKTELIVRKSASNLYIQVDESSVK